MSLLIKLLNQRIWLVVLSISISICNIAVSLWWNAQISTIINAVNSNNPVTMEAILKAVLTILISMGLAYLVSLSSSWTCETLAHGLRMRYGKHIISLSISEIENLNAGEQLSRLQNELNDVSDFLRSNLFSIVDDTIKFISTFSWMLWLNPKLTLLTNAPTVIILCYTTYTSKIIGKEALRSQQANGEMNGFADILITLFPMIRLFDAGTLIREKYKGALDKWERASILEERKRAQLMSLAALLSCFPLLLLLFIGGMQVIQGSTTLGTLYIFINLSGNVSGVMNNMPGRIAVFRRFAANMKRIEVYM